MLTIVAGCRRAPETFRTVSCFTVEACARSAGRAPAWAPRLITRNAQRRNGQRIVRCTTIGAAGNGLGTSIKYSHNERRRGQRPTPMPGITHVPLYHMRLAFAFLVRASFANKQKSTAGGWGLGSQCLCVEPELSSCVHKKKPHEHT
jgi:hypothetical protein